MNYEDSDDMTLQNIFIFASEMKFHVNGLFDSIQEYIACKQQLVINPAGKIAEKAMWRSVFFYYMALHIECRFNKNSLLQCYFLTILKKGPTFYLIGRAFFKMFSKFFVYNFHCVRSCSCAKCPRCQVEYIYSTSAC